MSRKHDWVKLPGLFYKWEFDEVVAPAKKGQIGDDYYFEPRGRDGNGVDLFAIFHRPHVAGSN